MDNQFLPGMAPKLVKPFRFSSQPYEYKVVALKECPTPEAMQVCDTPQRAADYWRLHVEDNPYFDAERECFVVLLLNTRRRVKGHQSLSQGTGDTLLVHPREVFRLACVTSAAALVLMHNLCAPAHKLCYVAHRVMCSHRLAVLTLTRVPGRKGCHA